ncbi:radical SAM/SPASM domain-containing protein [Thermodesulfobacteriota bacterium]
MPDASKHDLEEEHEQGQKPGGLLRARRGCNQNCLFCHRRALEDPEAAVELGADRILELVEESAELGAREWHIIGGGEPLFRSDVTFELMRRIKRHGMYGYLNTNFSLLDTGMIDTLVDLRWDYIKISLHGADAAVHDRLTAVPGTFERVMRALDAVKHRKDLVGGDRPRLEFGPVVTRANFRQFPEMVRLAHRYGVAEFKPQSMTIYTSHCEDLRLDETESRAFQRLIPEISDLCLRFGISTNISDFLDPDLIHKTDRMDEVILKKESAGGAEERKEEPGNPFFRLGCYEPWFHLTIWANGAAGPCGFTEWSLCDDIRQKSLKEVWLGDTFNGIRETILRGGLPGFCANCVSTVVVHNREIQRELIRQGAPASCGTR